MNLLHHHYHLQVLFANDSPKEIPPLLLLLPDWIHQDSWTSEPRLMMPP